MVDEIATEIINCFKNQKTVFVCGNGGSAEMSNHFVAELMGKFEKDRRALPAISLASNIAIITAIANDYGFEYIFSRQLEGLFKEGDLLITLSTSGISKNILKAQEIVLNYIAFPTNKELDKTTAQTQETHFKMIHDICRKVEEAFI